MAQSLCKRLLDVAGSTIGLVILSPLLVVIAILIKIDSAGPVIYRGDRIGRYGRAFHIFKFRTMVENAEAIGGSSTSNKDARITRLGRVLRSTKLDELPQLVNVLVGDMSLVGPRPEVREYVDLYTGRELELLSLRPGITDWASLWNSDEGAVLARYPDPDTAYSEVVRPTKLRLQIAYLDDHDIGVDIEILLATLRGILNKEHCPQRLTELTDSIGAQQLARVPNGGNCLE